MSTTTGNRDSNAACDAAGDYAVNRNSNRSIANDSKHLASARGPLEFARSPALEHVAADSRLAQATSK